ncbi:MAG: SIR2 family protein [Firmicutes bacterium]|nr:SIR2 family protein [Bacillota bacterium]
MEQAELIKQEQCQDQTSSDNNIRKFCKSAYFVGNNNRLKEFCEKIESCQGQCKLSDDIKKKFEKTRDKIRLTLKNYLELNNVSFLFGTGSSMILGAVSIRDIPIQIENKIKENDAELYNTFKFLVQQYQVGYDEKEFEPSGKWKVTKNMEGLYRWKHCEEDDSGEKWGNIAVPLEEFTNYLLGLKYVSEISNSKIMVSDSGIALDYEILDKLINFIKLELFKLCDLKYESNELAYHKKLIKSLLGRPLNLRRANIFTTNYDLVFEDAFEELGVHYINGFNGFNKRYFRPEIFDFDMYYPANLTEGKVNRVEKVIKYFKLHGSLTWVRENISADNIYGLREFPIEYIREKYKKYVEEKCNDKDLTESDIGDMMIYPTSYKKGYTLDFPYSELFRQFASSITQPQSVLFCIGYSFFDEHINDIIYQALSIPSFTLVIINLCGNEKINKLKKLNDPRILILEGEYLGDFKTFADEIMPNFHELSIEEKIADTLNKIHPDIIKDD